MSRRGVDWLEVAAGVGAVLVALAAITTVGVLWGG